LRDRYKLLSFEKKEREKKKEKEKENEKERLDFFFFFGKRKLQSQICWIFCNLIVSWYNFSKSTHFISFRSE